MNKNTGNSQFDSALANESAGVSRRNFVAATALFGVALAGGGVRDAGRTFDVLVDDQRIATQRLDGKRAGAALFGFYPIPRKITRNKHGITVRLQPKKGNTAGGVFDLRTVEADDNTKMLQ